MKKFIFIFLVFTQVLFAQENNISYRKLKWLNPWLIGKQLTNPLKKEYNIRLVE